jgi:ferritin-like metal-binding protein YciE
MTDSGQRRATDRHLFVQEMAMPKTNGKSEPGTLRDAFIAELRDCYDCEKQLTKALARMASAANNDALKEAIESHLEETRGHVDRLEQVFKTMDEKAQGKHCDGIAGIIKEGSAAMDEDFDESTMDAALIAGGQRAEHYEIAAYGTLIAWAKQLGLDDVVNPLQQNLDEEKAADRKLTEIAESVVNQAAAAGDSDESAGEDTGVTSTTGRPPARAAENRSRSARR